MTTTIEDTRRNGIDTAQLFGTLDAIRANPGIAQFQFRVANRWIEGTHNRSTIKDFFGPGAEDETRVEYFHLDTGEPAILLGTDTGPNPAEYYLHALAGCLTITLVTTAAARGITLTEITSTLEGNIDLQGALGLSEEHRNGFTDIKATFKLAGDADEATLQKLIARAQERSAVLDMVTNGVPVEVELQVG